MSNSRKKTPITGVTTAKSEKFDKIKAHKRLRRAHKTLLQQLAVDDIDDYIFPESDEISNVYTFQKDGKTYYPPTSPHYDKVIRK